MRSSDRVDEQFARAQFQTMSGADKLSSASFENMKAGLRANATGLLKVTQAITRVVQYEQSIIDRQGKRCWVFLKALFAVEMATMWASSPAAQSSMAVQLKQRSPLAPPRVTVQQDSYTVVRADTLQKVDNQASSMNYAEAVTRISQLTADRPDQDGTYLVVPFHEAQG